MFLRKQKSIKSMFSTKKLEKAMAKFFHYYAIPFNAADCGSYYQTMINIIAEAGPTGYQIGNLYWKRK